MSLKQNAGVPPVGTEHRRPRLAGNGGRRTVSLVANGAVLLGLAADDALRGSGGDDETWGLAGDDALSGVVGDDFIEARDGERDCVWCGSDDAVSADPAERVARGCEILYAG